MDKFKLACLIQDLNELKLVFILDNFFIHMTIFETFYVKKTTHKTSFLQKNSYICVQKNILKNSDDHVYKVTR